MVPHPRRGSPILAVVRRIVGRHRNISRDEMAAILMVLHEEGLVDLDTGWGGSIAARQAAEARVAAARQQREQAIANLLRRDPLADVPADLRADDGEAGVLRVDDLAEGWAACCRNLCIISVLDGAPGTIRFDRPGSMDPQLGAAVMFAPDGLLSSTIEYLADPSRTRRLLVVS